MTTPTGMDPKTERLPCPHCRGTSGIPGHRDLRSVFEELSCEVCGNSGWVSPAQSAAFTLGQMGEAPLMKRRFKPVQGQSYDLKIIDDPVPYPGKKGR